MHLFEFVAFHEPETELAVLERKGSPRVFSSTGTRNRPCGAGKLCDGHCRTREIRAQVLGKCAGICEMYAPPQAAREKIGVYAPWDPGNWINF